MKPLLDEPVLVHRKNLILADVHLGIEAVLLKSGVNLPSQIKKYTERILNLVEKAGATKLIFLGDVKHGIPVTSRYEKKNLPEFFSALKGIETHIIKGNHDGMIEKLVPEEVEVHNREMVLGKYLLTHGNKWVHEPGKCTTLVMGHNHPAIEFQDPLGFRSFERVWIRGKLYAKLLTPEVGHNQLKETIIMPAFNELARGIAFNDGKDFLGPYMHGIVRVKKADAYLLDGTHLGKINDLKAN